MLTQEQVDAINNVIKAATWHGGDAGGPYFVEPDELEESVKKLLSVIDTENQCYTVWADDPDSVDENYCNGTHRNYLKVRLKEQIMDKQTFSIVATDDNFAIQSDESYPGHSYIIESIGHIIKQEIEFQRGPVKEVGYNGITNEHLLAILIDRMKVLNQGKYACRENSIVLTKLEEALMWLNKRTDDRKACGVEGTNE